MSQQHFAASRGVAESSRFGRRASFGAALLSAALLAGAGGACAAGLSCTGLPAPGAVTANPVSCTVDCTAGGKLSAAIVLKPQTTSSLTITVKGTCVESNDHVPGGITIQGASSSATLLAPSKTTDPVLGIGGGVTLSSLIISGGLNAVRVRATGSMTGTNLVIEKAANADVLVIHGNLTLNTSTVEGSGSDGIDVELGGTVFMNGGNVHNNAAIGINSQFGGNANLLLGAVLQNNGIAGAQATNGGVIRIDAGTVTKNGSASGGQGGISIGTGGDVDLEDKTTVSNNSVRGVIVSGGSLLVENGATVSGNAGPGILVNPGLAKLRLGAVVRGNKGDGIDVESGDVTVGDPGGPALVQANTGAGLFMRANSTARVANAGNKITGNTGGGIVCAGAPANPLLYGGPFGTVSSNTCKTSP